MKQKKSLVVDTSRPMTEEEREDYLVSTHDGFVELIRRSRETCPPGSGIPLEDVERELGRTSGGGLGA